MAGTVEAQGVGWLSSRRRRFAMRAISTWRVVLAGGLAAIAGGALAVGVAAHTTHSPSDVAINAGSDYFYGTVSSPEADCLPGRRVRVFRKRHGDDKLFGAERSLETTGSYTVTESDVNLRGGPYYARIKKRDLRPQSQKHDHICGAATSNTTTVTVTK
jgi:hypothetical protein